MLHCRLCTLLHKRNLQSYLKLLLQIKLYTFFTKLCLRILYASVIIVYKLKKLTGKKYMQNTKYENVVIATIENLAALVNSAAHDSVVEKNNYNVIENVQALSYVFANYTQHTSAASLAAAALNSKMDTVVRETVHAQLTFIN
jgi:hypothetical protein